MCRSYQRNRKWCGAANVDPALLCGSSGSCRGNSHFLFPFLSVDEKFAKLVQVLAAGITWTHRSNTVKTSEPDPEPDPDPDLRSTREDELSVLPHANTDLRPMHDLL